MRIVAIDPGNDRTGFAVYEDGALVESDWFCPWTAPARNTTPTVCVPGDPAEPGRTRAAAACERQEAWPSPNLNVRRRDVRRVTPNKWRAGLGLLTKGAGKPYYVLAEARKVPGAEEVEDHRAEAILIGSTPASWTGAHECVRYCGCVATCRQRAGPARRSA